MNLVRALVPQGAGISVREAWYHSEKLFCAGGISYMLKWWRRMFIHSFFSANTCWGPTLYQALSPSWVFREQDVITLYFRRLAKIQAAHKHVRDTYSVGVLRKEHSPPLKITGSLPLSCSKINKGGCAICLSCNTERLWRKNEKGGWRVEENYLVTENGAVTLDSITKNKDF